MPRSKRPLYTYMNYFYGTLLKPGSTTSTPFFNVTTEEIIETLKNLPKPIPSDRPHWWQLEMTKDKSKAWEEDHGESDLLFLPFSPAFTTPAPAPNEASADGIDDGRCKCEGWEGVGGMDDLKVALEEVQVVGEDKAEVDSADDDEWVHASNDEE